MVAIINGKSYGGNRFMFCNELILSIVNCQLWTSWRLSRSVWWFNIGMELFSMVESLNIALWYFSMVVSWNIIPNQYPINIHLGGGIPTPLKNMKVSWGDDIPNIWKDKNHVPNHQLVYMLFYISLDWFIQGKIYRKPWFSPLNMGFQTTN